MSNRIGFSCLRRPSIQTAAFALCAAIIGLPGAVSAQAQSGPGQLRYSTSQRVVVEGDVTVVLAVERLNGSEGAVEVAYRTIDGSATAGLDYEISQGTLRWQDGSNSREFIYIQLLEDQLDEPDETFTVLLSNPTGGAALVAPSTATVTIVDDDLDVAQPGLIQFTATQYAVAEPQGSRTITVQRINGTEGPVTVNFSTSDGSANAGNDYEAASGTLQWNDGEGGQKSFDVAILDDSLDEGSETVNLSLSNPTGGVALGTTGATLSILDDDGEPGACVENSTTLCLRSDRRFRVEVEWQTAEGEFGVGRVVPFGPDDSGLFYFFEDDNAEVLVKVLDGCSLNNHFWVFAAAATNVEYTMTVTDTQTNVSSVYSNDLGAPAPAITDTEAFATCP